MKNSNLLNVLVIITSLLILFQSCSFDNELIEENDNELIKENLQTKLQDNPVVKKLLEMGYQRELIVETTNYYLVEGDLMFSKDIKDYKSVNGLQARHAHSNNLVSQTNIASMTVYIDPSVSEPGTDDWSNAIRSAIWHYNGLVDSKIMFSLSDEGDADIIIKNDDERVLHNNVIATAGFPFQNKPYNKIYINLDYSGNRDISEGVKIHNMVHELGHCIGLRHTNWDINYELTNVGENLIPWTPNQDTISVMNGGTANNSWGGFSSYDLIALRYLYPPETYLPPFQNAREWLNGPSDYSSYNFHNGDLNDDGKADLIGIRPEVGTAVVWLSNGDGFDEGRVWLNRNLNYSNFGFHVGDANADGKDDLIGIRSDDTVVYVWLNNGEEFDDEEQWLNESFDSSLSDFLIGDVNANGRVDFVSLSQGENNILSSAWLNLDRVSEKEEWLDYTIDDSSIDLDFHIGDVNNDGKDDIIGIRPEAGIAVVWFSNGYYFYKANQWLDLNDSDDYSSFDFHVGDVNEDGKVDIIGIRSLDGTTYAYAWLNNGSTGFNSNDGHHWLKESFDSALYDFQVGDVNADGRVDIIGIRPDDEKVVVWLSRYKF